ncbi:MAG: class II aldolase/adducin family protein [Spirochaetaceae bacterium]|nr:class II aldolase/adducin family protein [Spirochaetaceae bacterium]
MNEREARARVRRAGIELVESGLVDGTWGNLSVRLDGGLMAITPSGRDYRALRDEDIVLVDIGTGEARGGKPSTETPLHRAVYAARPEVGAVVHTHSASASTVAAARREVPPLLDDFAQVVGPSLRVADYALPGTARMAKGVLKALGGRMAALLANHGAVALGRDMDEALLCARMAEKGCRVFIEAEFLGGAAALRPVEAWAMHQVYLRKYSKMKGAAPEARPEGESPAGGGNTAPGGDGTSR